MRSGTTTAALGSAVKASQENGMRLIAVGASAGGVRALRTLVGGFSDDLDAIVLVAIHIAPSSPGYLPEILSRAGPLPCQHPAQGQRLQRARVYVAPPDQHMLVDGVGSIRLSRGPKENRSRPAIDPLFRSAALAYGPRAIGVILTGNLDDGTSGLLAVKQCGGTTVIQDPADAEAPSMPSSAARHVEIDHQVPLAAMASLLVELTRERTELERNAMPHRSEIESEVAVHDGATPSVVARIGDPSVFTCPDCHGTLMRASDAHMLRFRCHTGHAFTSQSLLAALNEVTEDAIWSAVRALHEGALLLDHLARQRATPASPRMRVPWSWKRQQSYGRPK
jgi:two-component system, chemotaxis family, protein-glutamate methylesterase/glutaminase